MFQLPLKNAFKADLLDLAPVIIAVQDRDCNIVWANKAYQKATGLTLKEIEGKKCFSVWKLTKPCRGCPVLTAIETGKQQEAELTPENQDNWPATQGSWLSKAVPLRDAEGNIIGALETAYEITECHQSAAMLQKNEREKSAILDAMSDLVVYQDLNHNVLWVNKSAAESVNEKPENLTGRKCHEIWANRNEECKACPLAKTIETGRMHKNTITTPDERAWIVAGCPIKDEKEIITGVVEVATDITEGKQAEEALRKSEKKYRTVLETTSEGCCLLNTELKINEANAAFCKMLGYSKDEILGKTPFDFVDDKNRKIFIEQTSKIADTKHRSYEIVMKKKNGQDLHTHFNATTIIAESGEISGCFAFITDLSDRKKIMDERNLLFAAIEQSAESVLITDKNGKIQYVNSAFERLTGYSSEEIIGQNPRILKSGKQDNLFYKDMWEKLSHGQIFKGRMINKKKDGTFYTGEATIWPVLDDSGKITNFVSIKRDVTKEIEMENLLAQAYKMESIGTLAGGIAHDFNNILSSIIGFTELAIDEVDKNTSIEDSLQEVYVAGKRAKDLVKQILAFARQSDEEIKPIQIGAVAKEVLKLIRSSIPTTIQIKQNIESDSLIMGNATQVHQILMNLCTNAAHAMEDEGGILELSLKDIVIDTSVNGKLLDLKSGNYIEIKVSDSGVGIAPEIIGSIFDPYFTTKGPGEGTGMGLAMVYGIVESYGGKITVDSTISQGTVFTFYLPITGKRGAHRPYEPEELPCGTEQILFIDDETSIAKMGSKVLELLGYSVTTRTSSVEALELFRSKPKYFDLVITDMTMPNMNGDKLAVELMKIRTDIPIIICTGYSKKISDETAKDIGIKAFAYKPIVKLDLAKIVRKVLDDQQQEQTTGRILVIDDEPEIRKLFVQKLAGKGYEIIEACDGKEGLKLYHETRPDLVITDLIMPEKEGIETITELKREFPNVKIIAISGGGRNVPDAYLHMAKNLGAERTFSKPIDWPELIKAVRELLK